MINDNAPRHTLRTVNNCMKKEQKKNICRELKQRPRRRRRRRQRERQKSSWFRLTKQQLCTCITLFCTFLCRRCTPTTWNFIFSRFVEDVNTRQQFSFSFPELRYSPLEYINPRKIRHYLPNWTRWNKRDKVWSSVNILFEWRFCSRRRRCSLRFLKCGAVHWQPDQCYCAILGPVSRKSG